MMNEIKTKVREMFDPLVEVIVGAGITPNMITVIGLFLTFIGAVFLTEVNNFFKWILTVVFLVSGSICDMLDGQVARKTEKVSKSGAFLDSVVDRVEEGLVYAALIYYYMKIDNLSMVWVVMGAWIFSYLISYTRARGEGLGIELKEGFFERPIRVVVILFGIVILPLLSISLWIVFIGTVITAFQRFFAGLNKLNTNNKKEDD